MPPIPTVEEHFRAAIDEVRAGLTAEQAADPRWRRRGNDAFWTAYFQRRHEEDVADRGNNGPVQGRCNTVGRKRWWRGRTVEGVRDYIQIGRASCRERVYVLV